MRRPHQSALKRYDIIITVLFLVFLKDFFIINIIFSEDVDAIVFEAADLHFKGEIDSSLAKFETAVRIDPTNEYAHNQLGILYAKKGRFEDAYREFSTSAGLDGTNTFALKWLGIIELRNGNVDKAFNIFHRIIQIDPDNADAYYLMGTVYNFRHNPVMAVEYLKKARDADADEAATHFRLGQAFRSLGMMSNALLEYQRATDLRPLYLRAIDEIGWIYYNRGETSAAIGLGSFFFKRTMGR